MSPCSWSLFFDCYTKPKRMPPQQPCRCAVFVGFAKHWRTGWRPDQRAVVALEVGIGTSLHCISCCRTARSQRATLALELFFFKPCGARRYGVCCLALPLAPVVRA
ncbi:hypothetical protein MRX96_055797 [Rhipicephalus microplus]